MGHAGERRVDEQGFRLRAVQGQGLLLCGGRAHLEATERVVVREEVEFDERAITTVDGEKHPILTFADTPRIDCHVMSYPPSVPGLGAAHRLPLLRQGTTRRPIPDAPADPRAAPASSVTGRHRLPAA